MRRIATIILALAAFVLLLTACSENGTPTAVTETDAAEKRAPIIYDPPPGFSQYLQSLSTRFDTVQWEEIEVTIDLKGGTVTVQPPGYEPIDVTYASDPMAVLPAGGDTTWKVTVQVPQAPASGTLWVPGDCMIYRTKDLPPEVYGSLKLRLPIMDFYDTSGYTGSFTSYYLDLDGQYVAAFDQKTVTVPSWPDPGPDPVVYVEVDELHDKNPSSATDRVLDPEELGDEE